MDCRLIAHRGEPACWPENALCGFRAALQAGACYLETDVQVSRDHVPVLSHDESLLKVTGHDRLVAETASADILALPAGYPERFGDRFADERIATLREFAELLRHWPQARAFVEIKSASVQAFGVACVVELVLDALGPALSQSIPISFDYPALQHVRELSDLPIGLVLSAWSDQAHGLASDLAPDYLFVNRELLPDTLETVWPEPWRWAAYTANLAGDAEQLFERGFDLVETDNIREMMERRTGHG